MSTSLLYHGFGIIGYRFLRHVIKSGAIFFGIEQDRFKLRCPACNSRQVIRKGTNHRRFRSLPIGRKPTFVVFDVPRVKCLKCGLIRQVKIGFANARHSYTKALELNAPLAKAYYLIDELRQFWQQNSKKEAERWLNRWIKTARKSRVPMLIKMASTLQARRFGLLNWYDHPISTGLLEGTNNIIKTLQRQAYGFRDHEFFKLKIFALHETRYDLIG